MKKRKEEGDNGITIDLGIKKCKRKPKMPSKRRALIKAVVQTGIYEAGQFPVHSPPLFEFVGETTGVVKYPDQPELALVDLNSGAVIRQVTLTAPSTDFLVLQGRYVVHLEESPWEVRFAETVPEQARVWVWDTVSGSYETFAKGRCRPRALRPYAPEGGRFLALDWEGRAVETWQTGGEDGPTARLEIGARVSEFAACEERLVVKLVSDDARETPPLQVWDMRLGERLAELRVAFERPQWSYLGHGVLATHSDREGAEALELWSLAEGVRLHPLEPPPRLPSRLSSTSTNRFLRLGTHLVRSLTSAQIGWSYGQHPHLPLAWDLETGRFERFLILRDDERGQVWNLARNTGGEEARVIFATNQRFVRVWNADLFPIAEFPLPANAAFACFTRRFLVLDRPLAPDRPRALEIYRLT